jgi:hypothetical protein
MFNKNSLVWALTIATMFSVIACSHYDEWQRNGIVSTSGSGSHNAGQDCMRCHHDSKNEASGKWWNAAGTIFSGGGAPASSAGTVQLWTGPNATGKLVYNLPIDRNGNFYTQKISNFRDGYFPIVISGNDTVFMPEKVSGSDVYKSCNNCHNGSITTPISIN